MAKLQLQSQIQLNKEMVTVETLLNEIKHLNHEQYVSVFQHANVFFPRHLRMHVLRNVLEPYVKVTRKERVTLADELNYRLKWFYQYSDFQYVNLLSYYEKEKLNVTYIENLLTAMFEFLVDQKREDLILAMREAVKNQSAKYDFKNIFLFNDALNVIFEDKKEEIDGLPLIMIRPVLFKGSTLQELKLFGEKYGIVVPRRLKKDQLLEVIFLELQSRGVLTDELKSDLKKKSVVLIQRYAIDHNIKVSTELKKDEIIEYILEFSHQTKGFYKYPQPGDYDLEIEDPFEDESVVEPQQASSTTPPVSVVIKETKANKEKTVKVKKPKENLNQEAPVQQTQEDVVKKGGTPLVLDRQTAKFLKLYAINKNQGLILLPDKKYHKKKRTFKVQLDQLTDISQTKKKHGLIGELIVLKFLGLILFRSLVFLLGVAFVLVLIALGYATASYFLDIEVLNTINDQINGFEILGKGILEHLFDFYRSIGI